MASFILPDDLAPFIRRIVPVWKTQGRRWRIVGYTARLNGDFLLVPGSFTTPLLFARRVDAEHALAEAAWDLMDEAATSADLAALPFEPTAYELAEMLRATWIEDLCSA